MKWKPCNFLCYCFAACLIPGQLLWKIDLHNCRWISSSFFCWLGENFTITQYLAFTCCCAILRPLLSQLLWSAFSVLLKCSYKGTRSIQGNTLWLKADVQNALFFPSTKTLLSIPHHEFIWINGWTRHSQTWAIPMIRTGPCDFKAQHKNIWYPSSSSQLWEATGSSWADMLSEAGPALGWCKSHQGKGSATNPLPIPGSLPPPPSSPYPVRLGRGGGGGGRGGLAGGSGGELAACTACIRVLYWCLVAVTLPCRDVQHECN